ncbi:MAG: tRNA 2-thiouridine(34) synthase MnmA [Solirubrobacteraceae bacterium]|jgi:tRNA-specific 2-thiouridylase
MDALAFEHHLTSPQGLGLIPEDAFTVTAGGGACCDTIRFSLATDGERITAAGFDAAGCGATTAAASAAVTLARARSLLEAARIGTGTIAAELGGLSPGKLHAAELVADALARALGAAARGRGALPAPLPPDPERTLVAISGGVDSAVAALLCARTGTVVAVTLELWADRENDARRSCCSASAVGQARSLAHSLGLPHFTIDLRDEFHAGVVAPFIAAFAAGETPNPCVSCNGRVRLDAMIELADRLGAASLATGHYARVIVEPGAPGALLRAAADPDKDQTYMLAALAPASLARMRFPLGELTKPQVRELARGAGLPVAAKPDSQDLCFLAGTDRARFLERHGGIGRRPGEIVDRGGTVLALHDGQDAFTVGQRRGIGVASTDPLFVLDRDAQRNRVVVGPREALLRRVVAIRDVHLQRSGARVNAVKLRYRSRALACRLPGDPVAGAHNALTLELSEPAAGAAPGQLACLMDADTVIGWGTIARMQVVNADASS